MTATTAATYPKYRRGDVIRDGALKLVVRGQVGPFVHGSNRTYGNFVMNAESGQVFRVNVSAKEAEAVAIRSAQSRARRLREDQDAAAG